MLRTIWKPLMSWPTTNEVELCTIGRNRFGRCMSIKEHRLPSKVKFDIKGLQMHGLEKTMLK